MSAAAEDGSQTKSLYVLLGATVTGPGRHFPASADYYFDVGADVMTGDILLGATQRMREQLTASGDLLPEDKIIVQSLSIFPARAADI